jgi:sarcosine oxidase
MESYDFVVLGLGAMGSAAIWQLAKRGRNVLGIDRFSPPHTNGSSHGESRITRLAIGEGPDYSPLAIRSHQIWRELESATGTALLNITGALIISSPTRTSRLHVEDFFANTLAAAQRYGIPHEVLSKSDIVRRFPQFRVREGEVGYYEPGAGFLRPEACIAAQLQLAKKLGAEIRTEETVVRFEAAADRVVVHTDRQSIRAGKLLICAGPWLPELIGTRYAAPFRVLRQVLFWFALSDIRPFLPENCPVYIWELQGPAQAIYGFPAIDGPAGGVKVATQQYETATTADGVEREVSAGEIAAMYQNNVAPFLAGISSHCLKTLTCLYTQTPDSGFVICAHPEFDRVIIASPCSGHGFKHSAAIGEALAEIAVDGKSRLDISPFALSRFHQAGQRAT